MFNWPDLRDKWGMRPFGTSQQLASRRERALDLLKRGIGPKEVARRVGATAQSVCRWRREEHAPKPKSRRPPHRPSRLSAAQPRRLSAGLKGGADANGWAEDYWTLDRIAHLIWDLFGIRYRASGVGYLRRRLGWSCQKPPRRSLARDEPAIAPWKHDVWPPIKKVA